MLTKKVEGKEFTNNRYILICSQQTNNDFWPYNVRRCIFGPFITKVETWKHSYKNQF